MHPSCLFSSSYFPYPVYFKIFETVTKLTNDTWLFGAFVLVVGGADMLEGDEMNIRKRSEVKGNWELVEVQSWIGATHLNSPHWKKLPSSKGVKEVKSSMW